MMPNAKRSRPNHKEKNDKKIKKKSFKCYLQEILQKEVKLYGQEENVKILEYTINQIITEMKNISELFKITYKELNYTGSYYENLRVKNATEFDINILLHFPFKNFDLKIVSDACPKGFAKCCLDKFNSNKLPIFINSAFFDTNSYCLLPEKIKSWMQSTIDLVLKKFPYDSHGIKKIKLHRNGPAMKLAIMCEKVTLDVDLVPAIEFDFQYWPEDVKYSFQEYVPIKQRNCLMIPKPPSEDIYKDCSQRESLWRLHFPGIENFLLTKDNSCIKSVIKLMKLLRDRQNWKCLVSYYLKTVVMLEILKQDLNWNQDQKYRMFVYMLKRLNEYVNSKNLPHIMYPEFNLFHKINDRHLDHIHRKLQKIINDIEKNRSAVQKYLSTSN